MNSLLTTLENEALDKSADLFNAFHKLPPMHPSDITDVIFHIHAIQNIILARAAYRMDEEKTKREIS